MKNYFGFLLTVFLSASLFVQCSNTAQAQLSNPNYLFNGTISGTTSINGTLNQNNNLKPVSGTGIDFSLGGVSPTTVSTTTVSKIVKDKVYGTWTPSFKAGTSDSTGVTYAFQAGTFFKDGPNVCITFRMDLSALTGGGGILYVSGTPYVVASAGSLGGILVLSKSGWTTRGPSSAGPIAGTHSMQFLEQISTGVNSINVNNLLSTAVVLAQGCYITSE